MQTMLQARALKAAIVLDAAPLAGVEVPNGVAKVTLRIAVAGRSVNADVGSKGLRKAIAIIRQAVADAVAVVLSGKLEAGDLLADAGVVAQPRAARPTPTTTG